ncbi:hypothetical protein JM658_04125 [Joostella atrarenae]|uniref:LTXXQ motif family protein n=1 Tax=Joostella atrarenae TaxID=679257 RepID=A0ABS9J0R0_9FLAO|nr:hypothetical protein [Joostella atrarenae]MCF8714006.1 hypothetical protein [Joostella atrarenae]
MKKTIGLLALVLITATSFAQERGGRENRNEDRKEKREDFKDMYKDLTPDQIAELKTKKMALELDLSDAQQKDIFSLNKDMATKHKAKMETFKDKKEKGEKPSSEELYEMMKNKLDEQLAVQTKMKNILNEDQYKMWKRSQHNKHGKREHRMAARK